MIRLLYSDRVVVYDIVIELLYIIYDILIGSLYMIYDILLR